MSPDAHLPPTSNVVVDRRIYMSADQPNAYSVWSTQADGSPWRMVQNIPFYQAEALPPPPATDEQVTGGDVVFTAGEVEMLRLCSDGTVVVKGREFASDAVLVAGFKAWMRAVGHYPLADGTILKSAEGRMRVES